MKKLLLIGLFFLTPLAAHASTQVIYGWSGAAVSASANTFFAIGGVAQTFSVANAGFMIPFPTSGTVTSAYARASTTPTGTQQYTVTLLKNGVSTGSTCVINVSTNPCTISSSIGITASDTMEFETTPANTPPSSVVSASLVFTPTTANHTVILAQPAAPSNSLENYTPISGSSGGATAPGPTAVAVFPESGTLSNMFFLGQGAGAAKSVALTFLNAQFATTSITCTYGGSGSGFNITFCNDQVHTASIVADATTTLATVPTGAPNVGTFGIGFDFLPNVLGNFDVIEAAKNQDSGTNNLVTYWPVVGSSVVGANTAEPTVQIVNPTTEVVSKMSVFLQIAPSGVKSRTLVFRVNGVDTALTCTVSGTAQTCTSTGSVTINAGDLIDTSDVTTNAANTTRPYVSYVMAPPAAVGGIVTAKVYTKGGSLALRGGSLAVR